LLAVVGELEDKQVNMVAVVVVRVVYLPDL
jgi:hypothetical protein